MFFDQITRIIGVIILLTYYAYWLIPLTIQVWDRPYEFEQKMKEQAALHPLNIHSPTYDWKAIIRMYRIFTLVFALVMLSLVIQLATGIMNIIL